MLLVAIFCQTYATPRDVKIGSVSNVVLVHMVQFCVASHILFYQQDGVKNKFLINSKYAKFHKQEPTMFSEVTGCYFSY